MNYTAHFFIEEASGTPALEWLADDRRAAIYFDPDEATGHLIRKSNDGGGAHLVGQFEATTLGELREVMQRINRFMEADHDT